MRGTYFAPFELYVKARRARATQRALKYLKRVPEDLLAPVKKKAVFILAELGIK